MTTITDIGLFFYQLLNVSGLTSLLNGGAIYRNQRAKNSTKTDIVIITRLLQDSRLTDVSNGETQIILVVPKILDVPDLKSQYILEQKIIELLENSINLQREKSFYFDVKETTEYDNFDGQTMYSSIYITLNIHKTN